MNEEWSINIRHQHHSASTSSSYGHAGSSTATAQGDSADEDTAPMKLLPPSWSGDHLGGGRRYSELGILEVRFPSPLHDLALRQSVTVEEWNSTPNMPVRVYPLV